ncbi:hypothetical protein [Pseudoalteromonas luteoviolacea]|uniref:Uncharacterized protein n=2 Tax=Pseudoalteromonas luteoviolacea TaxID=43657 RepID=A0A0F6A476_9GAMM|nr:hypothetical protein [Pseudoalteromonas luteoviolacea]AOT09115.1 hypothetical protein S4054249_15210 [Pseudoalteromonas luteoviolacea]AOT14028.1 hypothetical protein S40542_15180 [Pseudoalteromonas luteoviolacea]AOT18943.1 hypothetical protein S4054_15185 [Pseudoalteromonas luteoviolacea]KKE81012.1 hypothetical protein N479_23810 [Pseudoalteromonas luteoviolacea S4054]KZN70302.1 hypothetical protein N481_02180 [Pseudoalteromonas luteoviolacea S4047-1]
MSFLAIIPIWAASLLLYLSSPKQRLMDKPLNKAVGYLIALALYVVANALFAHAFPLVSALLASLVVLMLGLVSVTILSGKSIRLFMSVSILLVVLCTTIGGTLYVA